MVEFRDYVVEGVLGEGGMGTVYAGRERLSQRAVAIKVLHPSIAHHGRGRELFLREMGVLAALDHPNVVRCLACLDEGNQLAMVMEQLEGRTLREVMPPGQPMAWAQVQPIAAQVCEALRAAHGMNPPVVHRDLKPENIMLRADGRVKVMDFGIAKVVQGSDTGTTQAIGTLRYMSPEQIDVLGVDGRSDLYALGLILYELLAGSHPFNYESTRQLVNAQCTELPPPLPPEVAAQLPPAIAQLLASLLAKSPAARPADAAAVLQTLTGQPAGAIAASHAVTVTTPTRAAAGRAARDLPGTETPHRSTVGLVETLTERRRPSRLAFVIVGLFGLLCLLGIAWFLRPQAQPIAAAEPAQPDTVTPTAVDAVEPPPREQEASEATTSNEDTQAGPTEEEPAREEAEPASGESTQPDGEKREASKARRRAPKGESKPTRVQAPATPARTASSPPGGVVLEDGNALEKRIRKQLNACARTHRVHQVNPRFTAEHEANHLTEPTRVLLSPRTIVDHEVITNFTETPLGRCMAAPLQGVTVEDFKGMALYVTNDAVPDPMAAFDERLDRRAAHKELSKFDDRGRSCIERFAEGLTFAKASITMYVTFVGVTGKARDVHFIHGTNAGERSRQLRGCLQPLYMQAVVPRFRRVDEQYSHTLSQP